MSDEIHIEFHNSADDERTLFMAAARLVRDGWTVDELAEHLIFHEQQVQELAKALNTDE